MQDFDLHIHTTYSDGKDSPENIIKTAVKMGLKEIGFSDHSYTPFDTSYCINENDIDKYIDEINHLKEMYNDQIVVHLGIEQDYYSTQNTDKFDYIIGSVHYIKINDEYIPVDESAEILNKSVNRYFDGDIYSLIEQYYDTVANVCSKTNADIIGHIDLISKFNENNILFDENNERYKNAFKYACDKLLECNKIFEINTGAISRGYRTSPYPSSDIYNYLKKHGAKFILSSDSHSKDNLCYGFKKYQDLTK